MRRRKPFYGLHSMRIHCQKCTHILLDQQNRKDWALSFISPQQGTALCIQMYIQEGTMGEWQRLTDKTTLQLLMLGKVE